MTKDAFAKTSRRCACGNPAYRVKNGSGICTRCDKMEKQYSYSTYGARETEPDTKPIRQRR